MVGTTWEKLWVRAVTDVSAVERRRKRAVDDLALSGRKLVEDRSEVV